MLVAVGMRLGIASRQTTSKASKGGQEVGRKAWFISEACELSGGRKAT